MSVDHSREVAWKVSTRVFFKEICPNLALEPYSDFLIAGQLWDIDVRWPFPENISLLLKLMW